jgi:hypothetical protein
MPYRLNVTAGPSLDLSTHEQIQVNNDNYPLEIRSPHFRGRITVRVKNLSSITGNDSAQVQSHYAPSSYFDDKKATFSLQCQGTPA